MSALRRFLNVASYHECVSDEQPRKRSFAMDDNPKSVLVVNSGVSTTTLTIDYILMLCLKFLHIYFNVIRHFEGLFS